MMYWSQLDMSCLLISLCLFQLTRGSVLQFTANPSEIKEGLTSSVTLRCSLNDTSDSSAMVGRRDVTRTQNNMAAVTSIILMKDGQDVAAVSHTHPAWQVGGNSSMQVAGSVSWGQSGRGFLEVTLQDPAPTDMGEFRCEANGDTLTGHVVTFSATVELSSSSPNTADLVKYIRDMKQEMKITDKRLAEVENKTDTVSLFAVGLTKDTALQSEQAIIYDKIFTNVGNNYNVASGQYVCQVAGYYHFAISALSHGSNFFRLDLQHNQIDVIAIYGAASSAQGSSNSVVIKLSVGDTVQVVSDRTTSYVINWGDREVYTTFTGHLLAMI